MGMTAFRGSDGEGSTGSRDDGYFDLRRRSDDDDHGLGDLRRRLADDDHGIGRGERWTLEQIRRYGTGGFVLLMTIVTVISSLLMVLVCMLVADGTSGPEEFWLPAFVIGAIVPLTVAPPMLWYTARLIDRLDVSALLLRASSITDPLTGVVNRRGFFLALAEAEGAVEVGMADLDDFKQLNDRFGHSYGDAALECVARWLVELVGPDGTVGRIGGDEFAYIAAPDPERVAPTRQRFRLGDAEFAVSIGVATGDHRTPHEALHTADQHLYQLKAARATPTLVGCP